MVARIDCKSKCFTTSKDRRNVEFDISVFEVLAVIFLTIFVVDRKTTGVKFILCDINVIISPGINNHIVLLIKFDHV